MVTLNKGIEEKVSSIEAPWWLRMTASINVAGVKPVYRLCSITYQALGTGY